MFYLLKDDPEKDFGLILIEECYCYEPLVQKAKNLILAGEIDHAYIRRNIPGGYMGVSFLSREDFQ